MPDRRPNSTGVEIDGNRWKDAAESLFIQTGTERLSFHHNEMLDTHAGVQTSSAVYKDLSVTDNFFRGYVYNIAANGELSQRLENGLYTAKRLGNFLGTLKLISSFA
jgi:hypothetical protein